MVALEYRHSCGIWCNKLADVCYDRGISLWPKRALHAEALNPFTGEKNYEKKTAYHSSIGHVKQTELLVYH